MMQIDHCSDGNINKVGYRLLCGPLSRRGVPGFDGFDGVLKRLFQNAPADGPEHEAEHPSLEVLALAYDGHVNVGRAVRLTREGVVWPDAPPHTLESVVVRTTRLGLDQS